MSDPLQFSYQAPYPYASGYARVEDVTSLINAGDWDPNDPTAMPNAAQVANYLIDATAMIDAALAKRGYFIPPTPSGSFPATSAGVTLPTYNGIGMQAWIILRHAAAAYAASYVERSRHGSVGTGNEDTDAQTWMTQFNDTLTKIENGALNLTAYGLGGTFTPEIDPAQALASGTIGFIGLRRSGPFFTRWMRLGSGWETTVPQLPDFNVASNEARQPPEED